MDLRAAVVRRWVVFLFLASGFSGLVFQVAWVRMLTPVFGVSAYAISTVLASFMGGLALGSFLFGRLIDRRNDPLRVYALLESGIGLYAILVPVLFSLMNPVVRVVYHAAGEGSPLVFGLLRALLAFAILVIPTTLMGATLPVLCKFFIESLDRVGRETGKLYFINTLGAVVGCLAAGFLVIPRHGLHVAIGIAATVNLLVGLVAWRIHLAHGPLRGSTAPPAEPEAVPPLPAGGHAVSARWIVIAFGLSGLTALLLEVIWTRVLILIFGSTVYSFAAMVSVFLLGIALGGALFGKIADRVRSPYRLLGAMQAAIAIVVLLEAATINYLPELFLRLLVVTGVEDSSLTLIKFVISFAILFPATLLSGGTFPLVSKIYTDSLRHTGRDIGIIYSMNTVGAIVGSLLAGFLIVPTIGMRQGLIVAAWVSLATGVVTLLIREANASPRRLLAAAFAGAGIAGTWLLPAWNTELLSIPIWFQPKQYIGADGSVDLEEVTRETRHLFYAEGVNDTIIVTENPTERILSINGKIIATSAWQDMLHLKMLGHLPVLIHPGTPRTALNIGLGVGGTVSGLAAHDLEAVYGAELEPKVVQANPYFAEANDNILENPKFHVVVADGRNFLSMSDRTYDIISSDPFEPFMTGAGDLYSKEFFELGKRRLSPGGVMTQWVPLHQTGDPEFRSLLKTFVSVFPNCTVWFSGESVILIGTEKRLVLDPAVLARRMAEPGAIATLQRLGVDTPERLISLLVADETSLAPYLEGVPLNTDAFPFVEYASAQAILENTTGTNLHRLSLHFLTPDQVLSYVVPGGVDSGKLDASVARSLIADSRLGIEGMRDSLEGRAQEAFDKLTASVERSHDPFLSMWLANLHERHGLAAQRAGDFSAATLHYQQVVRLAPDRPMGLANLGQLKLLAGDAVSARALLERAHVLYPNSAAIEVRLAAVCEAQGERARALELLTSAAEHRPDLAMPLSMLAAHHLNGEEFSTAERYFRASLEKDPSDVETEEGLAQAILGQERLDDVETLCRSVVDRYPRRATCRVFLGIVHLRRNDLPGAKAAFQGAVEADPSQSEPHYQLARVAIAQGNREGATESLRRAIALGGRVYAQRAAADPALGSVLEDATR